MISTTTPLEPAKIKEVSVIPPDFIKTWFQMIIRCLRQISLDNTCFEVTPLNRCHETRFEMTTFAMSFDIPRLWKMYHTVLSMTLKNSLQPTFVKKEQAQSGGVFGTNCCFACGVLSYYRNQYILSTKYSLDRSSNFLHGILRAKGTFLIKSIIWHCYLRAHQQNEKHLPAKKVCPPIVFMT